MQNLRFSIKPGEKLNILCLGAHCDDIEIGCGGTLLKLIDQYENVSIKWVVFASNEEREREAQKSAELFLEYAKEKEITILDYKDGFLPANWSEVKNSFESLKEYAPDVIFTHYRDDLHQDHRTVNELTWNTFRNHFILEYEIPKYDGDLGNPNVFVPIEQWQLKRKKEILFKCFNSQLDKQWFDDSLLTSLPRLRGVQSASQTNYAEAFYSRKIQF